MNQDREKIFVVGAGAWGTALANTAALAGRQVTLCSVRGTGLKEMIAERENKRYLPGVRLHDTIQITDCFDDIVSHDVIMMVTPAQAMREVLQKLPQNIPTHIPFVLCSKGIELTSGMLLSDVLKQERPHHHAVILSGPSFAFETARGMITAVTIACEDLSIAAHVSSLLKHQTFRPYINQDVIGTQIGGAVKNVMAIATGIIDGAQMGENAKAALISRGLNEICLLAVVLGAKEETLMGLSGLSDLILTCSSKQSRNFSLGFALGQGQSLQDILNQKITTNEGAHTAQAVITLAEKYQVDMPITQAVVSVLNGSITMQEALEFLLSRPVGSEYKDL